MSFRMRTVLGAALLLAACTESKPAAEAKPAEEKKPAQAAVAAEPEAGVNATSGKSDPDCLGPVDTGIPEKLALAGDRTVEVNGYRLQVTSGEDGDKQAVIGVLASINEPSGENLFNLDRYLNFFRESRVELIVVAGDSGENRAQIEAVLRKVAASGLPVLAIAGNRETKADFVDAVQAVRKDSPNLINGNRVRYVNWDDVDLVTLPGYHDPRYIHPGDKGCRYYQQDLKAVHKMASEADDPVVLVAHGQPRGSKPSALDVIAPDQLHVGDGKLTEMLEVAGIPFGIFPNIKEAGATAISDLAGTPLAQGKPSDALYLNPGAADAVEWSLNDGSPAVGTAAILTVAGKQASYQIYRAPALTGEERERAAKLAAALPGQPTAQNE